MAASSRGRPSPPIEGSAHRSQGIAAETVRSGRSLEDAELDQEPQPDADADEIADPAERIRRLRRAGETEGLQQARDQDGDQAVEGRLPGLVAVLEAFSRYRVSRIEQGQSDEGHQNGAKGRRPEYGADDETEHNADDGEDHHASPVFGPVDAPVERRKQILEI